MKLESVENISLMKRALELAASSVKHGNHPFGAILVIDNHIVFEAENTVLTDADPVNPPRVQGPLLKMQAVEQHRHYWKAGSE